LRFGEPRDDAGNREHAAEHVFHLLRLRRSSRSTPYTPMSAARSTAHDHFDQRRPRTDTRTPPTGTRAPRRSRRGLLVDRRTLRASRRSMLTLRWPPTPTWRPAISSSRGERGIEPAGSTTLIRTLGGSRCARPGRVGELGDPLRATKLRSRCRDPRDERVDAGSFRGVGTLTGPF
jgi:hypothetical protein